VHWIQHKISVRQPSPEIAVSASVDEHGIVLLQGDDLFPGALESPSGPDSSRAATLGRFAIWKPRGPLLVVPTGDWVDGASNVFSLGAPESRRGCSVIRTTNLDHLAPNKPSPTNVPPLPVAARYAAGIPKARRHDEGARE
jgi:hypothetical protein